MKYMVSGQMTISIWIEVEADSPEAAREAAGDASVVELCNYCATAKDGVWNTSGELDGTPEILEVEEQP